MNSSAPPTYDLMLPPARRRPAAGSIRRTQWLGVIPFLALPACVLLSTLPFAVTIRFPEEGDTLVTGQPFRLLVDSDLREPAYEFTHFQIELRDPSSGYSTAWRIERPPESEAQVVDELLSIPLDVPSGDEYRLSVSAMPGFLGEDRPGYAFGQTIRVRVSTQP